MGHIYSTNHVADGRRRNALSGCEIGTLGAGSLQAGCTVKGSRDDQRKRRRFINRESQTCCKTGCWIRKGRNDCPGAQGQHNIGLNLRFAHAWTISNPSCLRGVRPRPSWRKQPWPGRSGAWHIRPDASCVADSVWVGQRPLGPQAGDDGGTHHFCSGLVLRRLRPHPATNHRGQGSAGRRRHLGSDLGDDRGRDTRATSHESNGHGWHDDRCQLHHLADGWPVAISLHQRARHVHLDWGAGRRGDLRGEVRRA